MKFFSSLAVLSALVASPVLAVDIEARDDLPPCPNNSLASPLYRLYNAKLHDHIYTMSYEEVKDVMNHPKRGYQAGVSVGHIFSTHVSRTTPLFRLHSSKNTDHFYTASAFVKDLAIKGGYRDEGITGYIFADASCAGTTPLRELWNEAQTDHLYIYSLEEREQAKAAGYVDVGTVGNVVNPDLK